MRKRITSIILASILLMGTFPMESMAATIGSNVIVGRTRFADKVAYSFDLNFANLTTASNKSFHKDVADAAILLSSDFGEAGDVKVVPGKKSVLEQLGFEDIKTVELDEQVHSTDVKDVVVFSMGRRLTRRLGRQYAVYAVAIRGTLQLREWESNFDVGSLSETYSKQTGTHPEWLNKDHHKGFDISSRRVVELLDRYIKSFDREDRNTTRTLLVTGHSRGAAVANLVGKEYEDRYNQSKKAIKPYTYTFATPAVSVENKRVRASYKTIFNLINDDDIVPCVPLTEWGFARYGKDIHMSIEDSRILKSLWVRDNMTEIMNSYGEAYGESMLKYSPIRFNTEGLPELPMPTIKEYQSAEADKMLELVKLLLLGDAKDNSTTRDFLYEYRDVIWVPNDISEDYDNYYEEVPYDKDSTEEEKEMFDSIAEKFDCKRVRIAPFFLIICLDRITTAILTDDNDEQIKTLESLSAKLDMRRTVSAWKENLETVAEIMESASTVSDDIKMLVYTGMLQASKMTDERDEVAAILKYFLRDSSTDGFMCSHMPITYYFMLHYLDEDKL